MAAPIPEPLSGGPRVGALAWNDLYNPSRQMVWRHLRSLRFNPPGRASRGERRRVFSTALEQAEELFTAGETIGYPSKPILLFYGISQAGRAIAAASTTAAGNDWRLSRHGIKVRNLDQRPPLGELVVVDDGPGSFTRLASMLRSGSLPDGAPLGELWATIPGMRKTPIAAHGNEYKYVLRLEDVRHGGGPATNFVNGNVMIAWIAGLPHRLARAGDEAEIASYLAAYPTLAGNETPDPNRPSPTEEEPDSTARVLRAWPMPADRDRTAFATTHTWPYRGDDERYVYPAIGGSTLPLYPLLTWWALLFTLSMLARYEPASWTKHLATDSSPDAVPLETVLSEALDAGPNLILHAIRGVSN